MATHPPRQQQLARLFIPPSLNSQQPMIYGDNAPMFSPSLPTSIQNGILPPFPMHPSNLNPLQTPMQPSFFPPQPPGAPGRPPMHRQHPSVIQLAAAGIFPPQVMLPPPQVGMPVPMTPLGQAGFPSPMLPGPPFQPFVPKSKRAPSVNIGGPPKAVLGGPQRKVTPLPAVVFAVQAATQLGKKKVVVNLPKETIRVGDEGSANEQEGSHRQPWARNPIPVSEIPEQPHVEPPELTTMEPYPSDSWRHHLPPTVDVFLPGKSSWDTMKRRIIEEKLERLGVERGSGSTVPHIHAPHARAASISSPADPALLYFKLNKLQQSQNNTASNSLSTSPQPPLQLSPSPGSSSVSNGGSLPPRFQGRHGHSISLAQPPSLQTSASPVYNPTAAFNPFGPSATLGSDQIFDRKSPGLRMDMIHAPQGRVPTNVSSLAPLMPISRPESKPDFARGFGLDATEEEEEPEEEVIAAADVSQDVEDEGDTEDAEDANREDNDQDEADMEVDVDADLDGEDGMSTVGQSRVHSRHVSKLSAALSLISVGRTDDSAVLNSEEREIVPIRSPIGEVEVDEDGEAIGEWTGSEDMGTNANNSGDESIGEFSNPSDEERARQERMQRRMHRKTKRPGSDTPRRIPNFPQPPDSAAAYLGTEEDIISNPSEEEGVHMPEPFHALDQREHFSRPASNLSGHSRPLPPLPHSRGASSQLSYHDPALAHSRDGSEHLTLGGLHPRPMPPPTFDGPSLAPLRRDSLNPLATPFVFGAATFGPNAGTLTHARVPSLGKPLNAAAQEFKPGGFTFQPPPGVPQLNFVVPRPLPTPPSAPLMSQSPARATQGREKRRRRGSSLSADNSFDEEEIEEDEDELEGEGKDSMTSFKFPPSAESPKPFRHSAPASPPSGSNELGKDLDLNPIAKSFTISGSGPSTSLKPDEPSRTHYPASEGGVAKVRESPAAEETTLKAEEPQPETAAPELPFPPATTKPKRAPIPLDFKHPVSTSTVPAAVFKNLNNENTEERTRRTVRSRLSSRDIFEHSPRPSLDDLHVPPISHRITRMFTDPGFRDRDTSPERDDVFSSSRRRTSLPPRHGTEEESVSEVSIAPMNLSRRIEMQQYEQRLEVLLDEKVDGIRHTLEELKEKQTSAGGQGLNSTTEAMISEVVSLFRTQLQESAARGLEESQMEARGELDFEVLKDIIEQSHAEVRNQIHRDIGEMVLGREQGGDFKAFAQQLSERMLNAVMAATSQISNHLHALERSRPSLAAERDAVVADVVNALTPHLASLRSEPIDYEGLTVQLTQAVKPHISQLIDLASDKQETAGLIVDRLIPILPSLQAPAPNFDADDLVGQLTTEMRRIIGPLDAHELKEQVSDLVVERLDSRLAVRDKAFNVDLVTEKVTQSISGLLSPLQDLKAAIDDIAKAQQAPSEAPVVDTAALRQDVLSLLSDLPDKLVTATDALGAARSELQTQQERLETEDPSTKVISKLDSTLTSVAEEQKKLVDQNMEFSDFCQEIIKHINGLPETLVEATKVLQDVQTDIMARDTSQKDAEEIRRLMNANSELQVNLAKARGAHGQVRVEKDMFSERLRVTEAERDRARDKLDEVQADVTGKSAEVASLEARNTELEAALSQALERIKSLDVGVQANQERISGLEKTIQELGDEKHQLENKVPALELNVTFLTREKDSLLEDVDSLRKQNEELSSQEDQWDELRRTNESIQALTALVSQSDQEELKDLRRSRDRFKVLEGEHTALQRRLKDQESKFANSERTAATARQSLTQAQQRAIEWEKRAKDHESELQSVRERLDQAEQSNIDLDGELSLTRLQLDERDAEERLAKDRGSKLRDQIASLEEQVARLQAETDQAKNAAAAARAQSSAPTPPVSSTRPRQNGYKSIVARPAVRPDSRASTVNGDARTTSLRGSAISPEPSVWDSIHAPAARRENPIRLPTTPKAGAPHRTSYYHRSQAPSPTPSNVSAAPTLQGDGWWQ